MRSMTGYGKAQYNDKGIALVIEIKSVNGRYQDLKFYLPRDLSFFEQNIRSRISTSLSRGSIDVRLNYDDHREQPLTLNEERLLAYHDLAQQAKKALGSDEAVPLTFLLNEPGVIESDNKLDEDPVLSKALNETLEEALQGLIASMNHEAESMKAVLINAMSEIDNAVSKVESEIKPFKQELLNSMIIRVGELVKSYKLDNLEQRLIQELAIYVDKYDIQEEITRLRSHKDTLISALNSPSDKDIGKTLNFIIQEMQREANTLGSKFSTSKTFKHVLVIKEEIEKCREIIQNVA